jgi:hypothetical protein
MMLRLYVWVLSELSICAVDSYCSILGLVIFFRNIRAGNWSNHPSNKMLVLHGLQEHVDTIKRNHNVDALGSVWFVGEWSLAPVG